MNTEEKHPTNALATALESFWKKVKGRRLYIYAGATVLVAALVVLVYILRHNRAEAEGQLWRELDAANTEEKLLEIIKSDRHSGHITQALARVNLGRVYTYQKGIEKLGTFNNVEVAKSLEAIEKGRDYYKDALNGLKDTPMLEQEAWVAIALAEQTLSGVPQKEKTSEFRGSIGAAIDAYKKAGAIHADTELSKSYAKKAAEMANDKDAIAYFYQQLYKFGHLPGPKSPHDFDSTPPGTSPAPITTPKEVEIPPSIFLPKKDKGKDPGLFPPPGG
jgi:hypothetical protein